MGSSDWFTLSHHKPVHEIVDYPAECSLDRHSAKNKIEKKTLKIIARQRFYSWEWFAQKRIDNLVPSRSLEVGGWETLGTRFLHWLAESRFLEPLDRDSVRTKAVSLEFAALHFYNLDTSQVQLLCSVSGSFSQHKSRYFG